MEERFRRLIFIPIAAVLCFMIGYQYVCPAESNSCNSRREEIGLFEQYSSLRTEQQLDEDLTDVTAFTLNFTELDLDKHVNFDIRGDDVMVFLHIQKTGGTTFGLHLVKNMQLEQPCECTPGQRKCTCYRPGKSESWLFSRFSTGWSCGVHADWTELTSCVPVVMNRRNKNNSQKRKWNFHYITMLRDPVSRYLSEWKHVQRGATWKTALHLCEGRPPSQDELPACYSGEDWTGVTLADFMNCPSNLANNRQVRMLADLSLVGCYNMSSMNELERGRLLLASAKANLRNMAFFGLTEYQQKTQYLFERTFDLRFIRPFTQINSTRAASVGINKKVQWRIEGLNALDVELYEYAKELFLQRYQYNRQKQHREERLRRRQERQRLHRTYLAELLRLGRDEEEEDMKVLGTTEDYNSQVVRW
ncbi:heparan-sulfate 6-O-sulfotransferase 3-B [Syngnathus scovelli]|uniref:heparan-sulfate 6-O-sulfotransferase 3-B n=1 Tax=Syngnathus scovelli TaxID=161590 RepID=UPI00210FFF2F|nr:heparan-sulfate 6-O-sulfotransferase 3-B [Syngnathus scovelli]